MNFSTNQVIQFLDVTGASVAVKSIKDKVSGETVSVAITANDKRSDFIKPENILSTDLTKAASEKLYTKALLVALSSSVNGGAPVAGQKYVLTIKYSGAIGNEDTYHKFASVNATLGMTAAQFYVALAKDLLKQKNVEVNPFYELKDANGLTLVDAGAYAEFDATADYVEGDVVVYATDGKVYKFTSDHAAGAWDSSDVEGTGEIVINETTVANGFYICEPMPEWELGSFPERLMNISVATNSIYVSSIETRNWLNSYDFVKASVSHTIYNTHKVADLEYFAIGEKGNSASLVGYPDNIKPDLKVDASASLGYDIYTIHFAYVGANASNQKSEKDLIIVEKVTSEGTDTPNIATIKSAIDALI